MKFDMADIKSIIRAKENDSLTIFVGAGFSKFSETETIKFPDWEELMGSFVKDLNLDENDTDRHNPLKIAQLYFLEYEEYRLYERLKEVIPFHATPDILHRALLELKPKYLLTTNWDNLLEKTITEQGLLYDVIKSDADFVKSNLPKKLIKIHGDLDAHNIIFKEDDYLNYSLNMPLIDNFLRHVLSSTTVLFLGYSYSDNDLKQIVKWIEKNSQVSPPRFLLNFKSKVGRMKYYENHHIRIVSPNEETNNFRELYKNFFESINNPEKILIQETQSQNKLDSIVDYFFDKLKALAELNALLPEQITDLFSNCTIEFHNNCFGLWFHQPKGVLTADYDESIRNLYSKFFEILEVVSNQPNHPLKRKMDFIISCFAIANIIFLKHNGNFNIFTNYFKEDSFFPEKLKLQNKAYWSFISFSKEMPRNLFKTLTFFRQENDQSAIDHKKFAFLEELNLLISKNKREKMYFTALINQFNYRFVATNIVLDYEIQEDKKEEIREILKNFDKKFTLSEYPNRSEKQLKVLLDFLEFKSIYNLYYHSKIDNSKVIHNAENIKKGSFGNYYKENRSEDNCIQILRFISANEINIDVYTEFKDLMQSYINSKISVQFINEKFSFKEHDLFILIKYFKFNDLLETIYERILPSIKETNQAEDSILFSDNIKEYLQETLDNILSLFAEYSHSFYTNVISDSFVNLLLVLSLINWEEDELKAIINKILRSFDKNNYPYNLIKAIDKFVLINYSLYSSKTNHFFKFIDLMLTKFVNGELSRVIGDNINNEFSHIYQFSHATTLKYDNLDLVKQAIAYIKYISNYNDERKRYFARLFLIQLFAIANEPTQQEIHSFLGNLRVKDWSDKYNSNYVEIFSELDFLQYGAELNKNFITFMDNWIQDYLTQDLVSNLHLLREGGVDLLMEYFNFLSDKKNLTEFEGLAKDLKDKLKGWGYADWQ